jgi:V-type H+-transporting ATPase subunit a
VKYTKLNPPTYFEVNEFTDIYQEIVDTYGVPTFHEANPALLTCITFPFLFGVMFGDIGHGAMVLFFASLVCYFSDHLKKIEGTEYLLRMRYLLLLMGFFATYMGILYNDFMSIPL